MTHFPNIGKNHPRFSKHWKTALAALAAAGLAFPAPAAAAAWQDKVAPEVLLALNTDQPVEFLVLMDRQADLAGALQFKTKREKGRYVFNRLRATAEREQAPLLAELRAAGAECQPFWIASFVRARGGRSALAAAAGRPEVRQVYANPMLRIALEPPDAAGADRPDAPTAAEWNIAKVNATGVWALGFTGQGAVLGGVDTGYSWTHPALQNQYRGWSNGAADHAYNWHDAVHSGGGGCGANSPAPCDDDTHGTHTMGTMLGDDGAGNQIGMAPGARWVGCRCMNVGYGTPAMYLECLQWMLAPTDTNNANANPDLAPHAINNSWGCITSEGCTDPSILDQAIRNLRAAGIMVVVSAGNSGSSCSSVNDPPALSDASTSVGNTDSSDNIAASSSRGPVTVDGSQRLKPDISAPGTGIRSSVPGGGYGTKSGTSMAAPHVAGLAALIISANPDLAGDVDTLERIMEQTALPRTSAQTCGSVPGSQVPNNTFGHGRIDAYAAVTTALAMASAGAPGGVTITPAQPVAQFNRATWLQAQSAGAPPLHYQWFQGAAGATNLPAGLDAAEFQTPQLADDVAFWVRVTNHLGAADSGAVTVRVCGAAAAIFYVAQAGDATPPYTNWATAAHAIQDAVGQATDGDLVLVTNGFYNLGSGTAPDGLNSRVALTRPITVRSVNGPAATVIAGAGPIGVDAVRGVYVTNGAVLAGFTVSNGCTLAGGAAAAQRGGGVRAETDGELRNCRLVNNAANDAGGGVAGGRLFSCVLRDNAAKFGAGAWNSYLYACTLSSNTAPVDGVGGGAADSRLANCLVVHNRAGAGAGCSVCDLRHCTISDNVAPAAGLGAGLFGGAAANTIAFYNLRGAAADDAYQGRFTSGCLARDPGGMGNTTNDPQFVDRPAGNYQLASNSPCIDTAATASGLPDDLLGVARPLDGRNLGVAAYDMGAYEFVHPLADTDGDRQGDADEVVAGTDPTRATSFFAIAGAQILAATNLTLAWEGMPARQYSVYATPRLVPDTAWSNLTGAQPLQGAGATLWFQLPSDGVTQQFYRLRVEPTD